MLYKLFAPERLKSKLKPLEGKFTDEQLENYNTQGYGIYWYPNYPSQYDPSRPVTGADVDEFSFVFIDMDEKDGVYNKQQFLCYLEGVSSKGLTPTYIIDSGRGMHAYWAVSDLDAVSFLRFQRRLCRYFKTDEAVSKLNQVMRLPGTINTKDEHNQVLCQTLVENDIAYDCAQLDVVLPPITYADEQYCQQHYDRTYNTEKSNTTVDDTLPLKFCQLLKNNSEVRAIWSGDTEDRSKDDFRLGHIMFASGFTKDEAKSVLVNAAKALSRAPIHRIGYANGIIDKIWTYEEAEDESLDLSSSVLDILNRHGSSIKGTRFPCFTYLDNTIHGFRLGQVLGLVAGVGVGKTSVALNMFYGFVQSNPDYAHIFISLEQPENEIADRWKLMCGTDTRLHTKVHVMSNYDKEGAYRNLSLDNIKEYILKFQKISDKKVGCVVIDHIGVLKKSSKEGRQSIEDICHQMKAFAVQTQTFLVMQSQAPREKAGIGDLELNKDAAYGTVFFESYLDYLVCCWQPLKRAYDEGACPRVTAYKFCKIRHKTPGDVIQEDIRYRVVYDGKTGHLRTLTQVDETAFDFFNAKCANLRKQDRKTEIVPYTSVRWSSNGSVKNSSNS